MATRKKTQPDKPAKGPKKAPETASPEEIARHFMTLWQQQWQDFLQNPPGGVSLPPGSTNPFGFGPSGFSGNFGQNSNHGTHPFQQQTADMAAAALAASRQCLELLEQFGQRLDDVAKHVQPAAKPKTAKKP
ncbi:MAG TPA: hypothetical protein VGF14_02735, partial [Alphaproteobacteria bacterium]